MGNCCGGGKAPRPEGNKPTALSSKNKKEEGDLEQKDDAPAPVQPSDAPKVDPPSAPEDPEEPKAEEPKYPDLAAPANEPTVSPGGTPGIVSTRTADPIVFPEYDQNLDVSEVRGETKWEELFEKMKANAEEEGKEVQVRPSRKDPDESQANKFYMAEQIFSQSVEEKHPSNSIDLHVIRVKEALQMTADRLA